MLGLTNNTPLRVELFPGISRQGQEQITCVIKAGFAFDSHGHVSKLDISEPIKSHDIFYQNDPANRSLMFAEESMPFKCGGELLIHGHAKPNNMHCRIHGVSAAIKFTNGKYWSKTLTIFGKRWWRSRLIGLMISKPEPLSPVALCYENAYGGRDQQAPEYCYPFNPVGKGYALFSKHLKDIALPQIECGPKYITSPMTRPLPAGFGPVARSYIPRLTYFSNSASFTKPHAKQYNVAPEDQQFTTGFNGGEEIILKGLINKQRMDIPINFNLPSPIFAVSYDSGDSHQQLKALMDTVVIDVDRQTIHLIYRCGVAWDGDIARQGEIIISE